MCSPLLAIATQLAVDLGWRVRQVWWQAPESADADWAGAELAAAVGDYDDGGPVRLLGGASESLAVRGSAN